MSRLTEQQLQTFSQEWRDAINAWAEQGYIVAFNDGCLEIDNQTRDISLLVSCWRGGWTILLGQPYLRIEARTYDNQAIELIDDWLEEAEDDLGAMRPFPEEEDSACSDESSTASPSALAAESEPVCTTSEPVFGIAKIQVG